MRDVEAVTPPIIIASLPIGDTPGGGGTGRGMADGVVLQQAGGDVIGRSQAAVSVRLNAGNRGGDEIAAVVGCPHRVGGAMPRLSRRG